MKKKVKVVTFKTLYFLLAFVVMIASLPMAAFAAAIDYDPPNEVTNVMGNNDTFEVTERREECVKHFRMPDGSYIAVQYEIPVHYLDESNHWQDIDNTLSASGSEYQTSTARVKFAKNTKASKTVFLKGEDYQLSFGLIGANQSKIAVMENPEIAEHDSAATKFERLSTLTKLISKVQYANAYLNTDIEYVLVGNNIKENIVIKCPTVGDYQYSFELKVNNLTANLNEDGSISIINNNTQKAVYKIPAPFMYDANGNYSNAVSYSMTQKNQKYTITVSADKNWINADDRVFPVTVDPTLEYGNESRVQSTYVYSGNPDHVMCNDSNFDSMGVSKTNSGKELIGYSKLMSIPSLPQNAILTEATVHFERRGHSGSDDATVAISQVLGEWDVNTITYNNRPAFSTVVLDYCRAGKASSDFSWDITSTMKLWMNGTPNYGLAFWLTDDSPNGQINFFLPHDSDNASKPYYQIKYRDTKGVEEYYDYFSSSADGAGTGHINAFNGNLVFLHDSISTTDELLPFTFGLAYNGVFSNQKVSSQNALIPQTFQSKCGFGFKLYTDETLLYKRINENGNNDYYYIWSDSDGTEHYFRWYEYQLPSNNSSSSVITKQFCDEDGLQLHLIEERDAANKISGYQIADDKNNIKHFNLAGYMDSIEDASGNKRIFERDSQNQVIKISLVPNGMSSILQLEIAYENGVLKSVTNRQTGLVANFYYSSAYNGSATIPGNTSDCNYLRKITYIYSSNSTYSVSFEYDSNGRLIYAKDLKTKMAVGYMYDAENTNQVTRINQYANVSESIGVTGATAGQSAGISYSIKKTTYRSSGKDDVFGTSDDIYTVYNFDDTGKAASVYTTDNAFIYGASNYTYADANEDNKGNANSAVKAAKTKNSLSTVMSIGGAAANYLRNPGFEEETTTSNTIPKWTKFGDAYVSNSNIYDNDNSYVSMSISSTNSYSSLRQLFYAEEGTYTFSALVNRWSLKNDAEVKLLIYDDDMNVVAESAPVRAYDSSYSLSTLWSRISVTFDTNENCISSGWYVEIKLNYINSGSTTYSYVYVDSAMLEKGRGASSYSLLDNGCFENTTSNWTTENSAITYNANKAFDSDGVLIVNGQPTKKANGKYSTKFLTPEPYDYEYNEAFADGPFNFVVSGWGKATSVKTEYPADYSDNTAKNPIFALKVVFHYLNTDFTSTHYIPFNDRVTDWQFASGSVSTQPDTNGNYRYVTSMDVYCCYDYNAGTAYFDNISVSKCGDIVSHYYYNEMGYLTAVESEGENGVSYEYDSNQTDISTIKTDNNSYETKFDEKHRITLSYDKNSPNNYKTEYQYDNYGNVKLTKMTSLRNSALVISNASAYSTNSNYFGALLTETDATGAVNRYFYDSKARLVGVCDANGNGLTYHYNDFGQLDWAKVATYNSATNSMVAGSQIDIYNGYNAKGQLESIKTDSATYNYFYDYFGNNTEIKVNGQSLVKYIYATNNGKLLRETYGNNYSIGYLYDGVDRITGVCYNGSQTATFSYSYNANGQVSEHTDLRNNLVYSHEYDGAGKLVQTTVKSRSENKVSYVVKNTYDEQGRLSSVFSYYTDTKAAPLTYTEYTYDSAGNVKVIHLGGTPASLHYTYDELGRMTYRQYAKNVGGDVQLTQNFVYERHNGSYTSGQIEKTILDDAVSSTTTEYLHDAAGNIISIIVKQGTTVLSERSYRYDSKGQLIRENIKTVPSSTSKYYNYTMTYAYDDSGNILYKRKYTYTTGSLDGQRYTQTTYAYQTDTSGDKWNDLLTSYDGNSITYDAIGNPLTYGDYTTFQWRGRELMQYHYREVYEYEDEPPYIDENLLQFEYDAEGRRIRKNNQYQIYEYFWDGDKLVRSTVFELYGQYMSRDIRFYYDAQGNPSAFRVFNLNKDGTTKDSLSYYLVTNTQGDVIAIYSQDGVKIYTYEYDAWGNLLKGTNTADGGHMADAYNPFRYRGYYWDWESRLYYVNSRYYNPQWGRFISADVPEVSAAEPDSVLRYNLYAYCLNNPVNLTDKDGTWPSWATKLIVGTAVIAAAAVLVVATGGAAAGPLGCFAVGALKGAVVGAAIGSATGAVTGAVGHRIKTGSWEGAGEAALNGAADGYMMGAITGVISGGMTSNQCFVAGTAILTSSGYVAIENIRAGDMVWASDPDTGETALKEVVQTFRNETTELVHVTVNGEEIICTNEHPFYSPVKGWTAACQLRAGDILVLVNGEYVVVEQVQHELLEAPVATYNFEVQDFHTYYVGEQSVLVHNLCTNKYYKATRTDTGVKKGVEITKKEALKQIRNGNDVIASSKSAAKRLAKDAFGNAKPYSEIHSYISNAMYHFHDKMHHIYHIFY